MSLATLSRVLAYGALAASGASCTIRVADFNAISTRNVNLDRVDIDQLGGQRVKGKSSRFIFLIIPFGFPNLQEAVDDALDKGNGDLLTDVAVYQTNWWFLVGTSTISVEGTAVDTRQAKRGGQ